MKNFRGVIIEESLRDPSLLSRVKILSTRTSEVTEKHKTPWLKKWTLHSVEIQRAAVEEISKAISENIDEHHSHSWYADYDDGEVHYIIFPRKIFRIDMRSEAQYAEAKKYGIGLGIPPYQVDFHPKERQEF